MMKLLDNQRPQKTRAGRSRPSRPPDPYAGAGPRGQADRLPLAPDVLRADGEDPARRSRRPRPHPNPPPPAFQPPPAPSQPPPTSRGQRMLAAWEEFLWISTFHGTNQMTARRGLPIWARVLWGILVFAIIGFCLWQIAVLAMRYFSRQLIIETRVVFDPVEFPAISFCNLNQIRQSKIGLGGDELVNVVAAIEDAQYSAVTGSDAGTSKRRRRRGAGPMPEVDDESPIDGFDASNYPTYAGLSLNDEVKMVEGMSRHKRQTDPCVGAGVVYTTPWGSDATPGFQEDGRGAYPKSVTCRWTITVPLGKVVYVTFDSFDIEGNRNCPNDYFKAFDGTDSGEAQIGHYCNGSPPPSPPDYITTFSNSIHFVLWSDGVNTKNGVSWSWSILPPGVTIAPTTEPPTTTAIDTTTPDVTTAVEQDTSEGPSTTAAQDVATTMEDENVTTAAMTTRVTTLPPILPTQPRNPGEVSDPVDEAFEPEVNLTGKPWFNTGSGASDSNTVYVDARKNLTQVMGKLPLETKTAMGHQLDDLVISCTFNSVPCTTRNFSQFYNPKYGNCYTFNSGFNNTIAESQKPGPYYGLSMQMFLDQAEYIAALSPEAGIRLLVHRQDQQPFPEDEGVDVSPGQRAAVRIRMVKTLLYEPFRDCTNTGTDTLYKKAYSLKACQKTCLQNHKVTKCGCADAALQVPAETYICSSAVETACSDSADDDLFSGRILCDCPDLCKDRTFDASIVKSEWPSTGTEGLIIDSLSERSTEFAVLLQDPAKLKKNFLIVEAYYEEIKYEEAVENPAYTSSQFVADLGGIVSIMIGASAISAIEAIYFMVYMVVILLCGGRRTSPTPDQGRPPHTGVSTSGMLNINNVRTPRDTPRDTPHHDPAADAAQILSHRSLEKPTWNRGHRTRRPKDMSDTAPWIINLEQTLSDSPGKSMFTGHN